MTRWPMSAGRTRRPADIGHRVIRRHLEHFLVGIDRVVELAARLQAPGLMENQRALQRHIARGNVESFFELRKIKSHESPRSRGRWNTIAVAQSSGRAVAACPRQELVPATAR